VGIGGRFHQQQSRNRDRRTPINKLTDEFVKWVPPSLGAGGKYGIAGSGGRARWFFRKNSVGLPQVALRGKTANDTRETVEHYLRDEQGLPSFVKVCWRIAFLYRLDSPRIPYLFEAKHAETVFASPRCRRHINDAALPGRSLLLDVTDVSQDRSAQTQENCSRTLADFSE
jgi:hypothetical protein